MKLQFFKNRPLAVALILGIAMVVPDAPPWISIFSVMILAYKFFTEHSQVPSLSRKITGTLSILLFIEVLVQYRSLFVQEASTTLLIGLTALKIMDYQSERDLKFLFLLGFILVSLKPLYNIDFYWMAPTLICFVGLWCSLLNAFPNEVLTHKYRFLFRIFLSAVPLTAALFILFPRFVVPWAQSQANSHGRMGFSDELNPGQVAELVATQTLVFRARFTDRLEVKTNSMYWRGAVLNESKGLEWKVGKTEFSKSTRVIDSSAVRYEVLLEPYGNAYFFGLEKVLNIETLSANLQRTPSAVFKSTRSVTAPLSYEGYSSPLGRYQDPPTSESLEFPKLQEKTNKWVEKVAIQFKSQEQRLEALENFFSDGSFSYSLKPGSYPDDGLDQFLFQKRLGFCEHFAGAYATLARALGIPARVITGFQGGSYNAFGGFWRVTTHDAHAWVEIFNKDHWQRIDPTMWVAPLRIEIGANAYFDLPEEERHSLTAGMYSRKNNSTFAGWLDFASNQIEFLNYRWTQALLDFDRGSQSQLWTEIKSNWQWAFLGVFAVILLMGFTFRMLEPKASKQAELARLYQEVFEWGREHQIPPLNGETPFAFTKRLSIAFPNLNPYLERLNERYDVAVYQSQGIRKPEITDLRNHWKYVRKNS
jgi:protein-glutamine gamma-glutamyltransferase